jgi:hypothetical protein
MPKVPHPSALHNISFYKCFFSDMPDELKNICCKNKLTICYCIASVKQITLIV